jgi:hypothetical protein
LLPNHFHLLPRTGNTPIAYRGEAIAAAKDHKLVAGRTHKNRGVPFGRPEIELELQEAITGAEIRPAETRGMPSAS